MTKITGRYLTGLKVESTHLDSGSKFTTVAPKDNNGDGSSFSPSDTVASALASCMLTICGIKAKKENHSLAGAHYEIEKIMQSNPRRIGKLVLTINLPLSIPENARAGYEDALKNCPVHHSLHPDIELDLTIKYL